MLPAKGLDIHSMVTFRLTAKDSAVGASRREEIGASHASSVLNLKTLIKLY